MQPEQLEPKQVAQKPRQVARAIEMWVLHALPVYIASPYNHPHQQMIDYRFRMAVQATCTLIHNDIVAYSPIVHNHSIAQHKDLGRGWEFWKRYDTAILSRCSALIVLKLPGWEKSVGVGSEIHFAKGHNIPTYSMYGDEADYVIEEGVHVQDWLDSERSCVRLAAL